MESLASSEFDFARRDDEQGSGPAGQPGGDGSACATSQAERALMHPDQSDLEWRYYCHAWSN